jgi:hypothetical protein
MARPSAADKATSLEAGSQQQAIDRKAASLLRAMSKLLSSSKSIEYDVSETRDISTSTGLPLQLEHQISVGGRRPGEMWMKLKGDAADRLFWLQAGKATLYDKDNNVFATIVMNGSIGKVVSALTGSYEVDLPTAQLLSEDLESILFKDVNDLYYIGRGVVAGSECHHILAREHEIDWQIWIRVGRIPLPCKTVITYKRQQGWPSITSRFTRWKLDPSVPDGRFESKVPDGVSEVEFEEPDDGS